MIKKSERFRVESNDILLIGCEHSEASDEFNPRETELYSNMKSFNPTIMFVEMSRQTEFGKSGVLKDVTILEAFSEDNSVEYVFYDLMKRKYFKYMILSMLDDEHINNQVMDDFNDQTTFNDIVNARSAIRSENFEFYNVVFNLREKKAIDLFESYLRTHSGRRIVVHCGLSHITPYYRLFSEMDDNHF